MKCPQFTIWLALFIPLITLAQEEPNEPLAWLSQPPPQETQAPIMWNLQAGLFNRLGGQRYNPDATSFLVTVDLSWLRWDQKHSTWGLGIHSAFSDDGGPRFAPKVLYRMPYAQSGSFVQLAGGVYLVGIDQEISNNTRINLPGYFLEAELGLNKSLSLVGGFEALPLDILERYNYVDDTTLPADKVTITNYWAGAKFGQKLGIAALVVGGIAVGIWAASFAGAWLG